MSLRSRVRNAVLGIACALVLLAQHVGLAHAVWHAAQQLPAHEQQAADNDRPFAPELTRLCAFDAAFGQVLGCAPPATDSLRFTASAESFANSAAPGIAARDHPSPRSRGPPARF